MTDEVEIESVATFYVGPTESFARSHAHSEINHERFSLFLLEHYYDVLEYDPDNHRYPGAETPGPSAICRAKLMIEMGKKGVNLGTINACLGKPVSLETRMTVQGPTIKADFNKHKGHLKTEKSIRDAVNHLLEKLKPVLYDYELSVEVNRKTENLIEALRDFHPNLGEYLDLLLAQTCMHELCEENNLSYKVLARSCREEDMASFRLAREQAPKAGERYFKGTERDFQRQKRLFHDIITSRPPDEIRKWIKEERELTRNTHGVWSGPMCSMVDELISSGFSKRSSYKATATLFKLQYPKTFTDDLQQIEDQVKQRYNYQKNKNN
jgi:hypothetical protein